MWLENPVTLRLIDMLKVSKENSEQSLINEVLHTSDDNLLKEESMGKLIGFKAQIQVIELIEDLETFLEIEEEKEDEEISSNDK